MVLKNFEELQDHLNQREYAKKVAVVCAQDEHVLEAVALAAGEGTAEPILIGDIPLMNEIAIAKGIDIRPFEKIPATTPEEAASIGVSLIREGQASFLMKGMLETAQIMKAVVNKETGIGTGRVMSHIGFMQLPGYHKLLVLTDTGIVISPTLQQKTEILQNALSALWALGYERPKVAVLTAVETVNPKMPETEDAAALKQMYLTGELGSCIVEGPISMDIAMDRKIAAIKGFESPVIEDADILLVPSVVTGNILAKALGHFAGGRMAGFVGGAKIPLTITSRGTSVENKRMSIRLCAAASK